MNNQINIGIFGLGTVGKGVFSIINKNKELFEQRCGSKLVLKKAVVSNLNKERGIDLSSVELSTDPSFILDDEDIQIVIELIGDLDYAERIIIKALEKGKSVLTANKAVIARKSRQIFEAAYKSRAFFGYEASVGSGIPVIRSIREGFAGDNIRELSGIMNSTTNFILTKMSETGENFADALKEAQDKGLAEPNPEFDIEGYDAAHKLIVLMNLSFNKLFSYDDLYVEGITKIEPLDMLYAGEMGYIIKHTGWAEHCDNKYYGAVHPVLVHESDSMASVNDAFNAIMVNTEYGGPFMLHGLGAGSNPAASGVISDLMEAARAIGTEQKKSVYPLSIRMEDLENGKIEKLDSALFRYYLRFTVEDKAGVLAALTKVLGDKDISISSMMQKEDPRKNVHSVPIVITTHQTSEKQMQEALKAISSIDYITEPCRLLRIKD
jgi:homoserine dehydrogenase